MYEAAVYTGKWDQVMSPLGESGAQLPAWASALQQGMAGHHRGDIVWHGSLAVYTTFKVGGRAEAIVFPKGRDELSRLVRSLHGLDVPWVILGRGSNVVIADAGLKGVVIVFGRDFAEIELVDDAADSVVVRVEAGCSLAKLVSWAVERGYAGLEFAAGIPGSVGGAIVMNAGAWQREMKDVLVRVSIMDGQGAISTREVESMQFAYRTWGEMKGTIALEGFFRLKKDSPAMLKEMCKEYRQRRKMRQPQNMASGGSFFKNPLGGKTAGQLIDQAGLKGCLVGGAMVSTVHANFIVNTGRATARDIIDLMGIVQKVVYEKYGITLEPEVKILGLE
ncbi:MAG: UDP-N-acetylmuramate dehydrogenase [Proteobacteria bacterium]|nr:UDP-N-acetylmuramate dehydrogenase [Pseudomonadota bacterium]